LAIGVVLGLLALLPQVIRLRRSVGQLQKQVGGKTPDKTQHLPVPPEL
jgi:hypothetical protein